MMQISSTAFLQTRVWTSRRFMIVLMQSAIIESLVFFERRKVFLWRGNVFLVSETMMAGCYAPLAHHTTIHMLNSKNNKYFQTKLQPTASIMTAVPGKLVPPIQAIQHTWTQPRMPRTWSMAVAGEGERLCLSPNHDWERQWCVFCKTQWVVL